jgi:hypothetical protein
VARLSLHATATMNPTMPRITMAASSTGCSHISDAFDSHPAKGSANIIAIRQEWYTCFMTARIVRKARTFAAGRIVPIRLARTVITLSSGLMMRGKKTKNSKIALRK